MYKLMIAEDEPLIRAGLKEYFNWTELGVQTIVEAVNGRDGVDIALNELPDLVITDIRMPEMDGLEMIGHLRKKLPDTLFIILSGYNEFAYAQKAIQYGGVHDYLLKPLQYETSFPIIQDCIKKLEMKTQVLVKQNRHAVGIQERNPRKTKLEKVPNSDMKKLSGEGELQLFTQIETYIRKHINQELTLNMVAEHFFYNPSYLSRLFKTKLNKNYMTFVSEIRIRHAQECLKEFHYSINDISIMCGYKSYKHFVKIFKHITNMTPTEYRKQLRL